MSNKNLLWVFVCMIVFLFSFYFGLVIIRHYKVMHHKREVLKNINRFEHIPTKEKNTYCFSTSRDLTYNLGNRDTTLTIYVNNSGEVDWYCGIFWDYRNSYYDQSSFLDKLYWDDFVVYGYLISQDTTTRENKLDKQILLAIKSKLPIKH